MRTSFICDACHIDCRRGFLLDQWGRCPRCGRDYSFLLDQRVELGPRALPLILDVFPHERAPDRSEDHAA